MANIIKSKPDAGRIENIINNMKQRDKISHLWNLKDKEELREHAYEIVNHMNGPEMTKLVNDHIVHTTIDFNSRIKTVFKLLKCTPTFNITYEDVIVMDDLDINPELKENIR